MTYIDEYQRHFIRQHISVPKKRSLKGHVKNKLSSDFDKLFFNFLVIIQYNIPMIYNKHEERLIKCEMAQHMESFKYKQKDKIITHLCYEDVIDLRVLSFLCAFHNVNMVFYSGHVMIKMTQNGSPPCFWVNEKKEIGSLKEEKYLQWLEEDYFEIEDVSKPLFSASHYKVDNLKEIVHDLGLYVEEEKGLKKKDYYELIDGYLNRILF